MTKVKTNHLPGVLSMVVDAYTNARVPDVIICPISISYDRILEESLYAYELLGIPKPKESLGVSIAYNWYKYSQNELMPVPRWGLAESV